MTKLLHKAADFAFTFCQEAKDKKLEEIIYKEFQNY